MKKNKIYITFDYELFFGRVPGSVRKSLLDPTNVLMELARQHDVAFTFFVDAGMLYSLKKYSSVAPEVEADYNLIVAQLRALKQEGHSLQLHVHPHWEDSLYIDGCWQFNVDRYRLDQFSDTDISQIVTKYKNALMEVVGPGIRGFRAGGWCIQPFHRIKPVFIENGIEIDCTLFQDGHMDTATHKFDFRGMPDLCSWRFDDDPMRPEIHGRFTELPISVTKYSRWFYLTMVFHRLLKTDGYRFLGDGKPIGGGTWGTLKLIFNGGDGIVSLDGFRIRCLDLSFKKFMRKQQDGNFVVLGHPKALCSYSFVALATLAKEHAPLFTVI